jgi:asparagine synthase (glutamine-hydrolysing)
MGFGCPVDHWFRAELKEMSYDLLLSTRATSRGVVNSSGVKALLDQHCSGTNDHHTRLWPLLMMELWFRMWVDGDGEAAKEAGRQTIASHGALVS